jgi:hypothetical protein
LTKPNKSFGRKKRFFVLERCTLTYYENDFKAEKLAEIVLSAETRICAAGALQINIDNVSVSAKTSDKTSYALLSNVEPQKRDTWIAVLKSACNLERAERLKAQQEKGRMESERSQAEDVDRQQAEEADHLKAQQEKSTAAVYPSGHLLEWFTLHAPVTTATSVRKQSVQGLLTFVAVAAILMCVRAAVVMVLTARQELTKAML